MSTQTQTIANFLNQTQNIVKQIQENDDIKNIIEITKEVHKDPCLLRADLNKIYTALQERLLFIVMNREEIKQILKDFIYLRFVDYWHYDRNDDFTQSIINKFKMLCLEKSLKDLLAIKREVSSSNPCASKFMYILDVIIADKIKSNKDEETLDSLMQHRLVMHNVSDSYAIKTIDLCIEEKVQTEEDITKLTKFSKELYDIQANLSGNLESGYYINNEIVRIMKNRINVLSSKIIESMNYSSTEEVLKNAPSLTEDQLVSTESIDHEIKRILAKNLENESLQVVFQTFQSMSKEIYSIRKYTDKSRDYLKKSMVSKKFIETKDSSIEQMISIFEFLKENKIYNKDFESKFEKEYRKQKNININIYTTIYFVRKKYYCEDKKLTNKYIELIKKENDISVLNKIIEKSGMSKHLDFGIQKICETRVLELIGEKSKEDFQEIFAKCIEKKYFYGDKNFFIQKAQSFGL